jgi:hypothetical protein
MADKNKYSSMDFSFLDEDENEALPGIFDTASQENPDQYANNLQLANQTGLSVDAVAGDPKGVQASITQNSLDFSNMSKRNPNTASFLVDYNNSAISHDDVPILERLENWFNPATAFENFGATTKLDLQQMGESFNLGGIDSTANEIDNLLPASYLAGRGVPDYYARQMSRQFASNMGINSDEELAAAKEQAVQESLAKVTEIKERKAELMPEDLTWIEEGVRGGLSSLIQNAPGAVIALAGGGRAAMLASMGAMVGLTSYGEGRSEGLTPLQAGSYASIDSAIEIATEILPLNVLSEILTGEATGQMTKAVARFMMQEMVGEQVATVLQSANAYLFGLDEELENASTAGEVADIMGRRAAVTAVATVVAGGSQAGIVSGIRYGIERLADNQNTQERVTTQEQDRLTQLNDLATDSKTRERDPEAFSKFLAQNDAGQDSQVYIDTTQAALYLQENQDQIAKDPSLQALQQKVNKASETGTDVSFPIEEYATKIAGTPHFEALKESTTLSAEAVAPFRQDQVKTDTKNYVESLMAEAEENVSSYVEAQEIFTSIRDQLIDTGQVNPKAASVMAQLVPAWATVYAKNNGITVQQAYEQSGLTIEGPQTGERVRLTSELSLLQRARNAVFGEPTAEPVQNPRLQRAREQGFDTEQVYYVSSLEDLTEFKKTGKFAGYSGVSGISVSTTPELANRYLDRFASQGYVDGIPNQPFNKNVIPVYIKKGNMLEVEKSPYTAPVGMGQPLPEGYVNPMIADGYDSMSIPDVISRKGVVKHTDAKNAIKGREIILTDPSQIRSVNAQFNDVSSADLLAQSPIQGATFTPVTDSVEFSDRIAAAKTDNPFGSFVYQYPEQDYRDMEMYTADNGNIGFAIKSDGDLVSVFKNPDTTVRGAMNQILPLAISLGATKLDAFEGFLTESYAKYGFVEVGRAEFNEAEAPPDWNYERDGKPDVIFMELAPEAIQARENGVYTEMLREPGQVETVSTEKFTTRTLGGFLDDLVIEKHGSRLTGRDDKTKEIIADEIAFEVSSELAGESSAANWYKESIAKAMSLAAEIHPELNTDPEAAQIFRVIMAITSNGSTVAENVLNTESVYTKYKETGQIPLKGFGKEAGAMVKGFKQLNTMISEIGITDSLAFLSKEFTVKELKQAGFKVSGELVDSVVPGSVIFGPKIGAFFQNLNGNFDYVTMDRWFIRSWARYTGTNIPERDGKSFKGRLARFRAALPTRVPGRPKKELLKNDEATIEYAEELNKKYANSGYKDRTELNNAAKGLVEGGLKPRLAPQNGKERKWIREVMATAQDKLAEDGVTLDFATMQALLWYREKNIFADYGVTNKKSEPTDYETEFRKLVNERTGSTTPVVGTGRPTDRVRPRGSLRTELEQRAGVVKDQELAQSPTRSNQREADGSLRGLPRNVGDYNIQNDPKIEAAARAYMEAQGLEYNPPNVYAPVNAARAARIAKEYDRMEHAPQDKEVKAAYDQLIKETIAQYQAALDAGLQVEFIDYEKQGDPYAATPREAVKDITENNHMYVFSTRDGFGSDDTFDPSDNPLLQETEYKISGQTALVNDLFRVVHDYFGHAKEGLGFRAAGEENAWRAHSAMFSPLARKAMTSETRGQNSWVNFGPNAEFNRTASAADTIYADQKVGLLPDWVIEQGAGDTEFLNQKSDTTNRGYYDPNTVTIRLTEASDLSTFLHEFAHFAYEMERKAGTTGEINKWFERNAADVAGEATTILVEEMGTADQVTQEQVSAFLNDGTTGDQNIDRAINRATHEQFARGFETYLMEGKAPSVELRGVFRTIAQWLSRIYNSIKGNLRVNLDADARKFFDALIATDEQIAAAQARSKSAPLFTDAEMAGMTDQQFAEYQTNNADVTAKAQETLRDKLIANITRQTKAWWKSEENDLIDENLAELKETQIYKTIDSLRNGEIKLDRAVVKEMVGVEKTSKVGNKFIEMPRVFNGLTITGGEGLKPDDAAAFYGYNSGAELLTAMIETPPIKTVAQEAARATMLEKHGDILNDGTIEREADEAMRNEERAKLILDELRTLAKDGRVPKFDRQTIKDFATANIANLSYRQIHPAKYRRAADNAALEAGRMLEAGNKEGAAQAKMRQLTNFYLEKAAVEAREGTLKIVDKMNRYNKKNVREEIMKAEGGYWEQIVGILNRFEFRKAASLRSVDQANQSINAWAKDRIDNHGDALVLANAVLVEGFQTHWKNVVYSDLNGIADSVANIEHVARYSNKIQGMQEEVDFKTLVNTWTDSIYKKVKKIYQPQRTTTTEKRSFTKFANGQMTKVPFLTSWLDGGERVGLSHDILMKPFNEALNAEQKMFLEVGLPVVEAMNKRSKADIKRHNTKIFIPEIKDAENDGNLMGHQVLAVALNTGNEGNLRKMLLGEGWATEENPESISFDNPQLQAVLKNMSESDWNMVQMIWSQMEILYPRLAEVYRKTTGLTPPKVAATSRKVRVAGKEIDIAGGYYPIVYDPSRSQRAAQNQEKKDAQVDSLFGDGLSIQASVNASSTNERTGFYDAIKLNLNVVPNHFQETIHYITHHDAVRQTNKLLRNHTVRKAIEQTLGVDEYKNLIPWLNDIAKDGKGSPNKGAVDAFFGRMRLGVTLGTMGFKVSTGLIQTSGLSNSMAEVGQKNMLQAMRMILGSPKSMKEAFDFANENSLVLPFRLKTMDREMRSAFESIEGKQGFMAAVQAASMKHIAFVQLYSVDLPSWYAGYLKELGNSGNEKKAFEYADWVIENVQGSGSTKDMATMMRNQSNTHRIFTMFMTFFSSAWNMQRDAVRSFKSGDISATDLAAKAMFMITIPVLYEMVMRGTIFTDADGDGEDELNTQAMLTNMALFPIQGIPVLRDAASGAIGDFGYNISPVASMIERGVEASPQIVKRSIGLDDKDITQGQLEAAVKLLGATLGVPGVNQVWATGEAIQKAMEEGEEIMAREFLFGPDRE